MDPYKSLREEAYEANMEIPRRALALYTWGNVSAFDRQRAILAIKPSGVAYEALKVSDMVVMDLEGKKVDGKLNPSSDTKTHIVLYRVFPGIAGVTHTHSTYAVAWAQARRSVPVLGTTHADHCTHPIPCTEYISEEALKHDYEQETGNLIVATFRSQQLDPEEIPMVLVAGHGPFTWGASAAKSVYHAAVLEEICKMAYLTGVLSDDIKGLPAYIVQKHYDRKHGANAYYGQR
ncbi:L-ribulose-5-phosphate 4-epimerase AraD [Gracilinema caldarium]|uniref:L-ribulose-5-phosphate 4-epimerase n=1 Tax=Gracilinema caldarium (strain ATCC 51460 / DSM 7334 / H1) TaxID=744872 RepID=F8F2D1_GRAC1|nr:L-ribulose-5-phosphate 4-epimerase AraD [Gracilinema caldarium]AEJ20913.1 L-ribulose-5-phosphate 4-epimerase [Gracilinema caldarium DSM 7334]